jgi:hypothetical protein
MATGTATIDFGAWPGSNEASVVVSDASVAALSLIEPFVMASDTTADHTAEDHRYLPLFASFTAGNVVASTSFTIYGRAPEKLQGTFKIRWAYV